MYYSNEMHITRSPILVANLLNSFDSFQSEPPWFQLSCGLLKAFYAASERSPSRNVERETDVLGICHCNNTEENVTSR